MKNARRVLHYACFGVPVETWSGALASVLPDVELRFEPDRGAAEEIDYILAWNMPPGFLRAFPRLRAIFSLGAGVEKLLADTTIPPDIPVVRMVDAGLGRAMSEFVLMSVLFHHRRMGEFAAQQRAQRWRPLSVPPAEQRTVGVLGLGELGVASARRLVEQGFRVRGWARRERRIEGIDVFAGDLEFSAFLSGCEILVCLLPLTVETRGILNSTTIARLPHGAALINVARGGHLVEDDLIAALDEGRLSAATLDVFETEPLPAGHRFWSDPRITIIPHSAALTEPPTAARRIAENIALDAKGEAMKWVVDRTAGY
ncbi:MAG: 2-hydroxyacid dehydrogenase [Caulobacteraceae bacterium]